MGFMDKAKEAALQAKASAQQLAQQGQAKVASVQQGRSEAELQRALGEALYAEQRRGGGQDAVGAALAALDEHYAAAEAAAAAAAAAPPMAGQTGPASPTSPTGATSDPSFQPPIQPSAAGTSAGSPPAGNFTLDDL